MSPKPGEFDALLHEERRFLPPAEFMNGEPHVTDPGVYERAERDTETYWADWAKELDWFEPWHRVLEWEPPHARWFVGGKLNVCHNCVDRHLKGPRRNKAALIWEGEPGDERILTYHGLHRHVARFGKVLMDLGVRKGDRVAIYLPMIPEAAIVMLACTRIGAIHSVVFGGFSPDALADRINDAEAKVLITADGGHRRGSVVQLKANADKALENSPSIEHVIVVARGTESTRELDVRMRAGRDHWYHELMHDVKGESSCEPMDAEDPLYILYTSGTTGKPKGVVHTTGGYLTQVYATTKWVVRPEGGRSVLVHGGRGLGDRPQLRGVRTPCLRGDCVHVRRSTGLARPGPCLAALRDVWGHDLLHRPNGGARIHGAGAREFPDGHDLSQLRLLGSVGEPINPEAWMWYHRVIGGGRCPIVDTWWQTETGAIMITPLPGLTETKPGTATRHFPGIQAEILSDEGDPVRAGYLAIRRPWPSMLRTLWRDEERFRQQYWSKWPDVYFPGDGAKLDADDFFWILGRVDDVLNVAGHRIGTMEVESALVDDSRVAEAAVVGKAHELKGQAIAAFVTLKEGHDPSDMMADELKAHVIEKIGAIARPEAILFTADLPKTRSGKIMRRLLKDIAEGRAIGDTTTLADPEVVRALKEPLRERGGLNVHEVLRQRLLRRVESLPDAQVYQVLGLHRVPRVQVCSRPASGGERSSEVRRRPGGQASTEGGESEYHSGSVPAHRRRRSRAVERVYGRKADPHGVGSAGSRG